MNLNKIKARCEAATPGPWTACGEDRGGCKCGFVWEPAGDWTVASCGSDDDFEIPDEVVKANAQFIAHARTDIPALIERIEQLEAEVEGTG